LRCAAFHALWLYLTCADLRRIKQWVAVPWPHPGRTWKETAPVAKTVVKAVPVRITKRTMEALAKRCEAGVRIIVADADERGLNLVGDARSIKFRLAYRVRGVDGSGKRPASTSITLKAETPEEARREARRLKQAIHEGRDPGQEKRQAVGKVIADRQDAVDAAVARYAEWLPRRQLLRGSKARLKPHIAREELAHLQRAVMSASLGAKPIAALDKADVARVLHACADQPNAQRHRFGALNKFCDWALDEGLIAANPCLAIGKAKRPKAGGRRDRVPSPGELAALWRAAERLPFPAWRDFARLLIALPARRNEAAAIDWRDLDLGQARWTIPGRLTKNGDPHALHLHPLALDLLRARHAAAGAPAEGLVLPAPRTGGRIVAFSALKRAIDRLAPEVASWTWHDFRRAFASTLGEAGVPEAVADAILNHRQSASRPGVLGVYQRSRRAPEQTAAMQRWGALLAASIAGETAANFVVLRA
jgi:integrase